MMSIFNFAKFFVVIDVICAKNLFQASFFSKKGMMGSVSNVFMQL